MSAVSDPLAPDMPVSAGVSGDMHVCFLNQDMGQQRTGVENAALLRERLFAQHLDCPVTILTSKFNPRLHHVWQQLGQQGLRSDRARLLNLYDYYQEAIHEEVGPPSELAQLQPAAGERWVPVPNTADHRVFDGHGRKLRYVARHADTSQVAYVNHIHHGRKWRRDIYDSRGFLSCVQLLDEASAKLLQELFLRPDGTVALCKTYALQQDRPSRLLHIQLLDRAGGLRVRLDTEEHLVRYWLAELAHRDARRQLWIIDKNRLFYASAIAVRDAQPAPFRIAVVSVIHAIHTRMGDVATAPTNVNYREVFADLSRPDAIVVLTEQQRRDILQRYGKARIFSISHAYDPIGPAQPFAARERQRLVFLARYSPEKNQQMALKAFARVAERFPKASLHFHGFGNAGDPTLPELRRLIQEHDLGERVFLHGWAHQIAEIYETAGMALLTSRGEAFALTIMESLCHGCPVLACDVRYGPRELIADGENGYLVAIDDIDALADRMQRILSDAVLHERLSLRARAGARRFSTANVARSWHALLDELAAR